MAFNIVAGINNAVYGSVSGSGSYEENSEVTLEVTVNDGYRFVQWDDGNTDNPRVFNATTDVTLVATLEAIPEYAVTLTVNNSNLGSTSGSGNYLEGSTATISATPVLHCRFVKWDDDNTDNPRTLTVNAAVTLEAIFETVNWYTITAISSDDTMGSVTGAGDYDEGDTVILTAVPETDYKFTGWSDGNTDNPRTFTASQSLSLSATFAAIIYTDVTIASNDNELGTVSGATSGNIETGSSITLTATPATDCKFDGWQVDGEMLEDTSTTITITVAENEMDVIAVFSAIVFYQVNLLSSDTDCGHITVVSQTAEPRGVNNNIWPEGTELELQAVCESGGNFLNWGDGDKNTTKYIIVSGNATIRANFYPVTGLILVTKKILNHTWTTIKNFFAAPTGASKIGAPANNALGATTLADVVNSVGQANGIAILNTSGKVAAADIDGTLSNDTTGNAATASVAEKVGTSTVGSSTEPVYINAGTPTACGGSLAVDITGNAATATTASACSGNAATATTATNATNVYQDYGTSNYNRPILLSNLTNITTTSAGNRSTVFSNNFYANPSTGVLTSVSGFSSTGSYTTSLTTSTHLAGNKGTAIINSTAAKGYTMLARMKSTNGVFTHGVYSGDYQFYYTADSLISAGTNNVTKTCLRLNENGIVYAPNGFNGALTGNVTGNVTGNCSGSSGSCTGNATTATTASSVSRATFGDSSNGSHDCNAIKSNGMWYYSSNGPATSLGASTTDGALYSQAYNTSWCGQIAQDYRNGRLFVRGLNNGTWKSWMAILDSGNYTSYTVKKDGTGASGSWGINVTGSSASCTGNAATATTATNANGLKVTQTTGSWLPLLGCVAGTTSGNNSSIYSAVHTSSTGGNIAMTDNANGASAASYIQLGNATACSSSSTTGRYGRLRMYGTNTKRLDFYVGNQTTDYNIALLGSGSVTLTLPSSTGTLALTSQIKTGAVSTSAGSITTSIKSITCSVTLEIVIAEFYIAAFGLNVTATIKNGDTTICNALPIYNPGTDGNNRYACAATATFLLTKNDVLTFSHNAANVFIRTIFA